MQVQKQTKTHIHKSIHKHIFKYKKHIQCVYTNIQTQRHIDTHLHNYTFKHIQVYTYTHIRLYKYTQSHTQ